MLVQFANTGVTEFNAPRFSSLLLQLGRTAKAETVRVQSLLGASPLCELGDGKNGFHNGLRDQFLGGLRGSSDSSESVNLRPFWPFLVRAHFAEAATWACSL